MGPQPGPLRIALFVEGSQAAASRRGDDLRSLWETLCATIGVTRPEIVFPIDKKYLLALNLDTAEGGQRTKVSGASEGLDDLLRRHYGRTPFDVAIVAWDLTPPWAMVTPDRCRWRETTAMYTHMVRRSRLPEPFLAWTKKREQDLRGRARPSARTGAPRLERGAILPLCMESCFESWFIDERSGVCTGKNGLRQALQVKGQRVLGWPEAFSKGDRRSAKSYLTDAIAAVRRLRPPHPLTNKIRRGWDDNQESWARFLAEALSSADPETRRAHPIAMRLAELLPLRARA